MKHVRRAALIAVVLVTVALPAAAQEGSCYVCRTFTDADGYTFQYCGLPNNEDWGYESCSISSGPRFNYCRNFGPMCYYMDVNG
jgi:hypothetical protein